MFQKEIFNESLYLMLRVGKILEKMNKIKIAVLVMGLGIVVLIIFLFADFIFRERLNSTPELFLCNNQPCNVILIIPESVSARHMGIYGYERDTTPFIDKFFGKEGIVFENAWSTAPWTWPSFASIFTSQLSSDVFVETWRDKLSDTIPTFIDVLERNGIPKFVTHTWTLFPFGKMDSFVTKFKIEERFQGEDYFLFLKAIEWIEGRFQKKEEQPFFLILQPVTPHAPYDPPEPYRYFFDAPSEYPGAVYEEIIAAQRALDSGENIEKELEWFRLQYDQEIRYLDSLIEFFISQISEEILKKTVFIFTSDHGQAMGQHQNIANMGHRGTLYEEEIHIPFIIKAPGVKAVRIHQLISHLDTGPTVLAIFGLEIPDTFRGISLLPLLQGKELQSKERIVWAGNVHEPSPTPEKILKIKPEVRSGPFQNSRERAARKENWKLIQRSDGSLELYNLEEDYWEQDNIILRWDSLSSKKQKETFLLFESLGGIFP